MFKKRQERRHMMSAYICHPYSNDPELNIRRVRKLCQMLHSKLEEKILFLAPQIYLGQFISESYERDIAMEMCLTMLSHCSIMFIWGRDLTPGMREEVNFCSTQEISVVFLCDALEPEVYQEIDEALEAITND